MSDEFFEDDLAEKKPAAEKPAQKSKNTAAKSGASKSSVKASSAQAVESRGSAFGFGKRVDLTWVIVVGVIAFTIGFVSNATFFNKSTSTSSTSSSANTNGTGAPQLTEDQIKSYQSQGTLPSGHPTVPGMNAGSTASTQTGTGAAQATSDTAAK